MALQALEDKGVCGTGADNRRWRHNTPLLADSSESECVKRVPANSYKNIGVLAQLELFHGTTHPVTEVELMLFLLVGVLSQHIFISCLSC